MIITAILRNGERFTAWRPNGLRFLGTLSTSGVAAYIIYPETARRMQLLSLKAKRAKQISPLGTKPTK